MEADPPGVEEGRGGVSAAAAQQAVANLSLT